MRLASSASSRRAFMVALSAGITRAAWAQPAGGVRRVGWLGLASATTTAPVLKVLVDTLRELGWIEGQNILFEAVHADGKAERLPSLVAELRRRKVDLIVTSGTTSISAAKDGAGSLPIVMAGGGDPVGSGFVQSIARPGGNITGVSLLGRELSEKNVDFLKQVVPSATRMALIRAAANPANPFFLEHMAAAGQRVGVRVVAVDIATPDEFENAFARLAADAAFMLMDPMFFPHRHRIAELAVKHRLPVISANRTYAEAGLLMTHGARVEEVFRATAPFIDKILRGAKPGDLPIEQPAKLDLAINLKTARALGITVPLSLLLRADLVIE
jgi:putative ABC transport system substrate-binding protein